MKATMSNVTEQWMLLFTPFQCLYLEPHNNKLWKQTHIK